MLGLGMLLATTLARPAFAETLAKPSETGGEKVKAPKSAPTTSANAPGPTPTADIKEGQGLVGFWPHNRWIYNPLLTFLLFVCMTWTEF